MGDFSPSTPLTLLPDDPAFTTDIWVMDVDGSHPRQVTRGGFDVEPVFSPDGQQIAFGRIVGPTSPTDFLQNEAIYVVRTDGTELHEVVAPRPGLEHPAWSPDGQSTDLQHLARVARRARSRVDLRRPPGR